MQTHQDEQETEIRTRAHAIWEDEGHPDGRHLIHWQRALMEVIAIKQSIQKQALGASTNQVTSVRDHFNEMVLDTTSEIGEQPINDTNSLNRSLDLIDGIGPKISAQLEDIGIATLHQIALLSNEEMAKIDENLSLRGRSEREAWITQAQELIAGKAPRAMIDQDTLANT